MPDSDEGHGSEHGAHEHGHHADRGWRGLARYVKHFPRMWSNPANIYVVELTRPGPGMTVVDIGAGMGPGVVAAAKRGATVIAVDPTPFMRRFLRLRRLGQRERKAISVVDGVAEHLPVAPASVDVVWAVNTMHHWQDLDRASAEIARVLRPGGQVVCVDEAFDHPDHEANQDAEAAEFRDHHDLGPVGASQMADALARAGLVDVEALDTSIAPTIPIRQATARKPTE